MLVLVSTKKTQGQRDNDFSWPEEGDLVTYGFACDTDEHPDDFCGCRRSMSGLSTRQGTTTVEVVERDMTIDDLVQKMIESDKQAGFSTVDEDEIREIAEDLVSVAIEYGEGAVLECRNCVFGRRN